MNIGTAVKAALMENAAKPKLAELKKATEGIEAIFIKDLLTAMRRGVQKVQIGESTGSEMYQDMFDNALAQSASKSGSMGLGQMLYKQMVPKIRAEVEARVRASMAAPETGSNLLSKLGTRSSSTPTPSTNEGLGNIAPTNPAWERLGNRLIDSNKLGKL